MQFNAAVSSFAVDAEPDTGILQILFTGSSVSDTTETNQKFLPFFGRKSLKTDCTLTLQPTKARQVCNRLDHKAKQCQRLKRKIFIHIYKVNCSIRLCFPPLIETLTFLFIATYITSSYGAKTTSADLSQSEEQQLNFEPLLGVSAPHTLLI